MTYLRSTVRNRQPRAIRYSGSAPVEKVGCEEMRFNERAIVEFLTAENIPPVDIQCPM